VSQKRKTADCLTLYNTGNDIHIFGIGTLYILKVLAYKHMHNFALHFSCDLTLLGNTLHMLYGRVKTVPLSEDFSK